MVFSNYNLDTLIIIFFAAIISITLHEYAHARVALWNGDYTAKFQGRLTLNPLKHFDPMGFLMMMLVGFGFAKPVPVNPNNFKKLKVGIFTVAIAGIVTNLCIAIFSALFATLLTLPITYAELTEPAYVLIMYFRTFFAYLCAMNVALALFNLLPLYPLDGFRIVEAFTRYNNRVTKFLRNYGSYILICLIGVSAIISAASLKTISPIFIYVDILGLYMGFFGLWIQTAFFFIWSFIK